MNLMGFLSLIYSRGVTITITIKAAGTDVAAGPDRSSEELQHIAECECGWKSSYATPAAAERGLRTHQTRHCVLHAKDFEWLRSQAAAGDVLDDD